jgi:hypothetical protein
MILHQIDDGQLHALRHERGMQIGGAQGGIQLFEIA